MRYFPEHTSCAGSCCSTNIAPKLLSFVPSPKPAPKAMNDIDIRFNEKEERDRRNGSR